MGTNWDKQGNYQKYNSDGSTPVAVVGSLPKDILAEAKTEADAVAGVLTFAENIFVIEIYNRDAVNAGVFTVNGLEINLPASESYMSAIGGTPSPEVTVTGSTSYIINRYEVE